SFFDARDQFLGLRPGNVGKHNWLVAVPTSIHGPVVQTHRLSPAYDIITSPTRFVPPLKHDPAVNRENALPCARLARENDHACWCVFVGGRQHTRAYQSASRHERGLSPMAYTIARAAIGTRKMMNTMTMTKILLPKCR